MTAAGSSYKGFRFAPEIISQCVWLYHRFPLSFRDVQELMLEQRRTAVLGARGRPARQRARQCGLVAPNRGGRNEVLPPMRKGLR